MKEVIIIAGANGTGKTTFARYYSEKYPYDFINPDDIAREISPDNLEHARVKAGKKFLGSVQKTGRQVDFGIQFRRKIYRSGNRL